MIGTLFTLKQLETLIWVADLRSFRKAATHLGTTQPNVSARIAAMEDTLGVTLLHRNAGPVTVTETGADVIKAARRVLREAEGIVALAGRADLVEERLRLGVTELIACTWLHRYLRRLKATYPAVRVELTVDLAVTLDTALATKALDLTLQSAPFGSEVAGVLELGAYPYVWVAAPALGLGRNRLSLADLREAGVLTHARHTQAFGELAAHAQACGLSQQRFMPSSSIASCLNMARDGLGAALLPEALVAPAVAEGALQVLNMDWLPTPLRFAARYHAGQSARFIEKTAQLAVAEAKHFAGDQKT